MSKNSNEDLKNENHVSFLKSLPKPQRIAFLSLSAISLGIIVLWVWQFNSRLNGPFYVANSNQTNVETNTTSEFETALLNFDTDGDGLTDNEERSLYGTSPYLEDTDSDGISDRVEIEQGTDPNCATGQNCSGAIEVTTNTPTITPPVALPSSDNAAGDSADAGNLELMMSGQADVDQLRALLLDSGADASMLQQLSDEELLKTYQEMLAESSTSTQ